MRDIKALATVSDSNTSCAATKRAHPEHTHTHTHSFRTGCNVHTTTTAAAATNAAGAAVGRIAALDGNQQRRCPGSWRGHGQDTGMWHGPQLHSLWLLQGQICRTHDQETCRT